MPVIQAIQPLPISIPGLSVLSYGTATATPIGISNDRATFYGTAGTTTLYQTVNSGTTWTVVNSTAFTGPVLGLLETDDGEALCVTQPGAGLGNLYKSSGWTASHTAATWTLVQQTTGGYFKPYWCGAHCHSFGNDLLVAGTSKFGVINEYGGGTTSGGAPSTAATRVWFTSNYGATWTMVLDLKVLYPTDGANLHGHSTAYDPYWDRIWYSFADTNSNGPAGAGFMMMIYSDDHGVTWNSIAVPAEWATTATNLSMIPTSITVLKDCLLLGNDLVPGWLRIARKGYRNMGPAQIMSTLTGHSGATFIAMGAHQNRNAPDAPILLGCLSQALQTPAALMISNDNGATMTRLWDDPALANTGGPETTFGPDINGKILSRVLQTGTTYWQLVGELIIPDAGMIEGFGVVTGDAVTTVFNFAHGLPNAPSRFMAWQEKPNAIVITVTATATNVVLTFASAPANLATIPISWRAGP